MANDEELSPFEEWPYKKPSLKPFIKAMNRLAEEMKDASSGEEALRVYRKYARGEDKCMETVTSTEVRFSINTLNQDYKKGMDILNEEMPLVRAAANRFEKAMRESPYRPYLESKLGSLLFLMQDYEEKCFDEQIVGDLQEESRLSMAYDERIAACRVAFRGEEHNLPEMGKYLKDPDRETRKEASEAYYACLSEAQGELEGIYDRLVKVRDRMAKKLGFKSYTDLAYYRMGRYDYTKEMVASYRESVREEVTPLAASLVRQRFHRLGYKKPEIYDLSVHFPDGDPVPFGSTEDKVRSAERMYSKMSPETEYYFRLMVDKHLLFLEAKKGKQSGGYMTYFPLHKVPIIFSNFNGTTDDVDVLTHEFGHSFQYFMARDIKVPEYRMPTAEGCEIDSMSMEFFAEPYMDLFFDKPDRYRHLHLEDAIEFLPYGVTVDEFQEWVYDHPGATPAERDAEWHALEEKYTPWKVRAEKDCPYLYSGHRWLTQGHIFSTPFYYIDYTLAQVVAFEFLEMDKKNHEKAWHKYVRLCKMGGKYPFCALLKKAGLKSPFDEGVLRKVVRPLKKILASYEID